MGTQSDQLYVRGTTVDPARRYTERHKGSPGWDAFVAALTPEQRWLIDEPIKRRAWYDLATYASVIEVAAQHLAPDDQDEFLSGLGGFVMDDGVTTLYKAFFLIASPAFVIRGSALLWGLFFKGSKLRVVGNSRKHVDAAITGAAFCTHALCVSIGGGMLSALTHAGARRARKERHVCRSEGKTDRCEFRLVWD